MQWAYNSVVECHPDKMEVGGSNPPMPTIIMICRNVKNVIMFEKEWFERRKHFDESCTS